MRPRPCVGCYLRFSSSWLAEVMTTHAVWTQPRRPRTLRATTLPLRTRKLPAPRAETLRAIPQRRRTRTLGAIPRRRRARTRLSMPSATLHMLRTPTHPMRARPSTRSQMSRSRSARTRGAAAPSTLHAMGAACRSSASPKVSRAARTPARACKGAVVVRAPQVRRAFTATCTRADTRPATRRRSYAATPRGSAVRTLYRRADRQASASGAGPLASLAVETQSSAWPERSATLH